MSRRTGKCLDCNKAIDSRAIRCRSCARKGKLHPIYGNNQYLRPKHFYCIDCKKEISIGAKWCQSCSNRITATNRIFPELRKRNITLGLLKRKNGRIKQTQGYILIYIPIHPFSNNNKYVFEHRLVMENHIRRYLKLEERVHHLNNIKTDNRIENLKLFPNESEHQKYHKLIKGLICQTHQKKSLNGLIK